MKLHESYPTRNGGTRLVFKAKNGYGASVITDGYGAEQGLFELGVLVFLGDDYSLTYYTPITEDVVGYLTWEQVRETLDKIEALPKAPYA
jgi:hypothetical protein